MLFRKMFRDMRLNKAQFISIFIMTVLGIFIYTGVSSEWYGIRTEANDYYKETNLADAWIYSKGFDEAQEKNVEKVNGVTGVERRLTFDGTANLNKKPTVRIHFVEKFKISTFRLLKGEQFSLNKDGIWLDSLFAEAQGLKLGDMIEIVVDGYPLKKEIKGLVMSPEYVYSSGEEELVPVRANFGYGFLSYQSYPRELPLNYTELMITTQNTSDTNIENSVDQALDGKYSVFLPRKSMRSYMQLSEEIKEHKAVSRIFPIIFLAVAMLTIVTTMARLVGNQRTQIGILKAVGFKRNRILFHYVSYGLWLSLIGTLIGAIVGPLTLPYLFYGPMQTVYTLPEWSSRIPYSVILICCLSVIISTLITYVTCKNVLKVTPSESLRPKAPKLVKHSFVDRMKLWQKLSFDTQWNLRDVIRCKGRTVMAIVGVLGCCALLICAFSMQDTLDYVINWNYVKINQYESRIELDEKITENQADDIINHYGGEKIMEGAVELKANGEKKSGELLVTDHASMIHYVDFNCNEMKIPEDQISVTYKMAKLLKLKKGDVILWHVYGEEKWNKSVIGAIYRTPLSQGITMSKDLYEKYNKTFVPTAIISDKNLSKVIHEKENDGITKVRTKKEIIDSYQLMSEAMNLMVYVLILAAFVLAGVVIYNLGVLSFTERSRELSTLKVIGFKTRKLRSLLLTQNIWLTLAGIIPGIPIGIWMIKYIFRFLGDVFDFFIVVSISSYIFAIVGTLLVSVLVNRLFSRRIKKIDMVSSLKGVE